MDPERDAVTIEQVARDLSGPLRTYLRRYTGSATVAEDLLQETLVRIARGLAGFEGRASLKTWAFAIATRVAADHYRAPEQRLRVVELEEIAELPGDEAPCDDRLVLDEMNACVRQVIESLPEDYRAALVLHDLEGLTAAQVAEVCGCSLATAKIRIHRARGRLRTALERQCDFYRGGDDVLRCDRKS